MTFPLSVSERMFMPVLPLPLAYICCTLNFIIPGTGTVLAGITSIFCSRNDDMPTGNKIATCCSSVAVGILQLLAVSVLLLGWAWSISWGVQYVQISKMYYNEMTAEAMSYESRFFPHWSSSRLSVMDTRAFNLHSQVRTHKILAPPTYEESQRQLAAMQMQITLSQNTADPSSSILSLDVPPPYVPDVQRQTPPIDMCVAYTNISTSGQVHSPGSTYA